MVNICIWEIGANMYIKIGTNNGSEKLWTKKPATSSKPIKAVYV